MHGQDIAGHLRLLGHGRLPGRLAGLEIPERLVAETKQSVFDAWDGYLPVCRRDRIEVSSAIEKLLPPGFENRAKIFFQQKRSAYSKLEGQRGNLVNDDRTAAYVLYLEELWDDGPGMISCFGLDADGKLAADKNWNRCLKTMKTHRENGMPHREIADRISKDFGVFLDYSTVFRILNGKRELDSMLA